MSARTLPELLLQRATEQPDRVALREKTLGRWREITWADYAARAAAVGAGLRALGVGAGERVAIHSENRPEWLLADLGAQGIGAISVGVYPTSPAAEVEYLLGHSHTRVVVVEDEEQLDKTLAVRKRLKALETIVVIDTRGVRDLDDPMVMTFAELEDLGRANPIDGWGTAAATDAVAMIVYTSGTTGPPKGAMLSHDNLLHAANTFAAAFTTGPEDEVLSYLPLSHVAERLVSLIDALKGGYTVNFGEGGESFAVDLREIQPTFFLGVPRVWEKMLATVEIRMADASRLKRVLYRVAVARGRKLAPKRMRGRLGPIDGAIAALLWILAFRSLREKLGLSRVRVAVSGAAPIAPQVLEYFWALGVPVREGYGQTEGSALATYTPADDVRIGKVGKALPGVELRIADDGEILLRSNGVFVGYLDDKAATAATIDADGWLHTGDVGDLDRDGFLTITDRKKDIIITAGGKNVSPSEIENMLKVSPYVREAIVIGDKRKYLTALIGIEADTVGNWATRQGVAYTTYRDLSERPEVKTLIATCLEGVNAQLAQVETIKRFELLPKELDPEEGELTATQKVKRAAIAKEFAPLIDGMYK
ncbi:MAG TPA: AMP-binding protein [Acidimicrobiales bacterium]|nr:AMP-binding protein [Acidimicrobiales bacterium]